MSPALLELSYLERLCKGDRAVMATFIRQYLQDTPSLFQALEAAAAAGDAKALAIAAHDLRPHAHYMGAAQLRDLLMEIDHQARGVPPIVRADLVAALIPLVEPLAEQLRAAISDLERP